MAYGAAGAARPRHGAAAGRFRASLKTWGEERTNFPGLVIELSLAHRVGNAVENAYRRGDVIVKRRKLMEAWATFCCTPPTVATEVVPLRKGASA